MPSLFSKIIAGEIPASIVHEDDEIVAFRDINPQAPQHVLIVPRREIATINDLSAADAALVGRMVLVAQRLAREFGIAESGYRLVMNCNRDGGQTVDHIHIHLLGGRPMGWPPG
jgi:histidine triad (HIT) family protein